APDGDRVLDRAVLDRLHLRLLVRGEPQRLREPLDRERALAVGSAAVGHGGRGQGGEPQAGEPRLGSWVHGRLLSAPDGVSGGRRATPFYLRSTGPRGEG